MPHKKSKPTDPWAALLERAMLRQEKRPTNLNAKTADELNKMWGVGDNKGAKLRKQLIASGDLLIEQGKVFSGGKLVREVWYYPPDENEGKKLAERVR